MSERDELIVRYAADLKDKCGINPEMDLLTKVTIVDRPFITRNQQQWQEVSNQN